LSVLRRRKWLALLAVTLTPSVAVGLSLRQPPLYRATAEVLLNQQGLAASVTGAGDPSAGMDPARELQTLSELAATPVVAQRVVRALHLRDRNASAVLTAATVAAKPDADLLVFTVVDRDARLAARIATSFATEFTRYRQQLDKNSFARARARIEARLRGLDRSSGLYSSLVQSEERLDTVQALQSSNAAIVRDASGATQFQPRPVRSGILGLLVGFVFAAILAVLAEALDTRVRSTQEIEKLLGLPLLARIPEPEAWMQRTGNLSMLADPHSIQADAYGILRTNVDFFNLEHGARTIMVTSALDQEGKSTTAANLAIALSRAGQRVILVDLDLRRPMLQRFFKTGDRLGITDVVEGKATISFADDEHEGGSFAVVTTGTLPADAAEFIGGRALAQTLADLREHADIVIVDAPPLLAVGDAIALSGKVDAMIVLTRLGVVRRRAITELKRVLKACPAKKIGFVVTGAENDEDYRGGYGYSYSYSRREEPIEPERRRRGRRR